MSGGKDRNMKKFKKENINFEQFRHPIKRDNPITFRFTYNPHGNVSIIYNGDNKDFHRKLMLGAMRIAKRIGYHPYVDKAWLKEFRILWKYHRWASNGSVGMEAEYYETGGKIEFWATGKRYCLTTRHEGISNLPYIEKCRIRLLYRKIKEHFTSLGAQEVLPRDMDFKYSYDNVAHHKYSCWHWKEEHDMLDIFSQQYTNGDAPASYNAKSRDGEALLRNGQLKYFYNYKGVLSRGYITHNLNNMWWVIVNNYEYRNISSGDLFDFISLDETPIKERRLGAINRHIKHAVKDKDYLKAHLIQKGNELKVA